ncbi:hypothetical protein WA158_004983 [Blastocystis sp. Blastoise]
MNALEKLKHVGIVNRVCKELENHIGMNNKDVAEFIIFLVQQNPNVNDFYSTLKEQGVELDRAFAESLHDIVTKLSAPPKATSKPILGNTSKLSKLERALPGLALPDTEPLNPNSPLVDEEIAKNVEKMNKSELKDIYKSKDTVDRRDDSKATRNQTSSDHFREESHHSHHHSRHSYRSRSSSRDHSNRYHSHHHSRSPSTHEDDEIRRWRQQVNSTSARDRTCDRTNTRRERSTDRYTSKQSLEVTKFGIYDGKVKTIVDYGAFIELLNVYPRKEGLCHISQICNMRLKHPSEVLQKDQIVKVKVLAIEGTKVSISMKEVDQNTGEDLNPSRQNSSLMDKQIQNNERIPRRPSAPAKPRKRMNSKERYEIRQLINSGVLKQEDYPELEQEIIPELTEINLEPEEDIDIELNNEPAPFLEGTEVEKIDLEPIKIVKNPEGSLNRGAINATALAKERRELRRQQEKEEQEAASNGIDQDYEDPLSTREDRLLANDMKNNRTRETFEIPEWKKESDKGSVILGMTSDKSIKEQRESLPIYALKNDLIKAINDNNILVVIGETGSGKTTQMTQYLVEAGYSHRGIIGCTQPRRVAATSIAERVSVEFGCTLGAEVGYSIRFQDCTSNKTIIKYMTDGMLMREYLVDPDLSKYSVIILDEAHERTVHTDVLFCLLKKLLLKRKDLKVIITSATLDAEKFSDYYYKCPIFRIPGRTFPVKILHAQEPSSDYFNDALSTVLQIHLNEPAGDILVFFTGQEEIDNACEIVHQRMKDLGPSVPKLNIYAAYGALPTEMQHKIFEPTPRGERKVVFATNIAEASLTIDGIYYVIDPGFCKQNVYNPKIGMDSLIVTPISKASANQRAGRAGRTGPGMCYRLYTQQAYETEMNPTTIPEIQRTNLANVVLNLKAMGINNLLEFDLMDPPAPQSLVAAMESLYTLGCLDDEGLLTPIGRKMAEFPLDPPLSKVLLKSVEEGCSDEILTIVAMLSVENIFMRPKDKQVEADQKHSMFFVPEGDHLSLLNIYESWIKNGKNASWCRDRYIQDRAMKRADDIRNQLMNIMKCIVSGYFTQVAKRDPQEGYKTILDGHVLLYIHPSSALFNRAPEWILYHELVMTTKEYMRNVISVEPSWLIELAPKFFKKADPHVMSERKRNEKIEPLFNPKDPTNMWRLSKRR